jgi:hypothetical protein
MHPRTSQLSGRPTQVGGGGGGGGTSTTTTSRPSNLQEFTSMSWSELRTSALDLSRVRSAVGQVLGEDLHRSFVGVGLRPAMVSLETMMESTASRQFGLLGRLALMFASPEEASSMLKFPQQVLVFAIHSCILNSGYTCTGSSTQRFEQSDSWPDCLPPAWSDSTGKSFAFRYRLKSEMSDKLMFKAELVGDTLVASVQNPYDTSSNRKPIEIHLRVADFVKSKAGAAPDIPESKARELMNIIEQHFLMPFKEAAAQESLAKSYAPEVFETGGVTTATRESNLNNNSNNNGLPRQSALQIGRPSMLQQPQTQQAQQQMILPVAVPVPVMGNRPPMINPGFSSDLIPGGGGGGGMLFGPGNPQFDNQMGGIYGGAMPPGRSGGNVPAGARFDPYGPPPSTGMPSRNNGPRRSQFGGEPDPDHYPPPGNNNSNMYL